VQITLALVAFRGTISQIAMLIERADRAAARIRRNWIQTKPNKDADPKPFNMTKRANKRYLESDGLPVSALELIA
jgi:hypothetical protein